MSQRVDAVVFDVGRVLVQWDLRFLFGKLIDDPDRLEWFVSTVVTPEWHYQHDAGRPLDDMIPERIAQFPHCADLIEAYRRRFGESIPGAIPGSLELVEALARRGVPLFAITNFGAEFWPEFRADWPILERFQDIVVSGVEKLAKPGRKIFDLAAQRFGHAPEAMLFIDDSEANIIAARDLGWQVHHFVDAAELEADLSARGLL